MLITHVKPSQLWGKKVFDAQGHLLGEVVAIASRRGVVRKVVVQRTSDERPLRLIPSSEARVDAAGIMLPAFNAAGRPSLRLVH